MIFIKYPILFFLKISIESNIGYVPHLPPLLIRYSDVRYETSTQNTYSIRNNRSSITGITNN